MASLLSLPQELRDEVYKHVYTKTFIDDLEEILQCPETGELVRRGCQTTYKCLPPRLGAVCRQLRDDMDSGGSVFRKLALQTRSAILKPHHGQKTRHDTATFYPKLSTLGEDVQEHFCDLTISVESSWHNHNMIEITAPDSSYSHVLFDIYAIRSPRRGWYGGVPSKVHLALNAFGIARDKPNVRRQLFHYDSTAELLLVLKPALDRLAGCGLLAEVMERFRGRVSPTTALYRAVDLAHQAMHGPVMAQVLREKYRTTGRADISLSGHAHSSQETLDNFTADQARRGRTDKPVFRPRSHYADATAASALKRDSSSRVNTASGYPAPKDASCAGKGNKSRRQSTQTRGVRK